MAIDPELTRLISSLDDLARRVERLEQIANQRPVSSRPFVVPPLPARASLESRLGSQYLNRAGIIALLIGIAFFLNWAFANHWIGPLAIVLAGFAGGVGLFVFGEWFLRRAYRVFGFSLQGLGIASLYLTLWAASQYYQILLTWAAFTGMILLTAVTASIAVVRDTEALAIFAAIGGFATPLLLSTGRDLELELFAYVLILCAGMLLTLRFRPWLALVVTTFVGAIAVSLTWFAAYYRKPEQLETLIFFSLLFAIFVAAPVLAERRLGSQKNPALFFVTPAATLVFLLGTVVVLDADQFLWTAQAAAILLIVASWRWCADPLRVVFFVTAVAASATSIPVAVDAHWATSAVWLAYGVALMLFGFFRKLPYVRWAALALIGVMVVKVFLLDLSNLGQGYRILALSILGVALLALSFLYQRDWLGLRKQ